MNGVKTRELAFGSNSWPVRNLCSCMHASKLFGRDQHSNNAHAHVSHWTFSVPRVLQFSWIPHHFRILPQLFHPCQQFSWQEWSQTVRTVCYSTARLDPSLPWVQFDKLVQKYQDFSQAQQTKFCWNCKKLKFACKLSEWCHKESTASERRNNRQLAISEHLVFPKKGKINCERQYLILQTQSKSGSEWISFWFVPSKLVLWLNWSIIFVLQRILHWQHSARSFEMDWMFAHRRPHFLPIWSEKDWCHWRWKLKT